MSLNVLLGLVALVAAAPAPVPQATTAPSQSIGTAPTAPLVSSNPMATSHGPYTGPSPTTTGALSLSVLAQSVAPLPELPQTYIADGQLHDPQPAPYIPHGGLGTNGTTPSYKVRSDFDYESIAVALYQEWIELDLFHNGLARFSVQDFQNAGLTAEDRALIEFMADQEIGHATLLTNMLGPESAPKQCTYNYPYTTVREFIDFCQKLTRFGESGVYGFLNHLDSRDVGQMLLQSISTEARQQMIFRQFDGLFPMPVWFEVGVPQSWAWTLLAPYISSCPANQTRLAWQNFPSLTVLNQPNPAKTDPTMDENGDAATGGDPLNSTNIPSSNRCLHASGMDADCPPAITNNRSMPLSYPGRVVHFEMGPVGEPVGPNNSYITSRGGAAMQPRFCLWASQLNVTYSPLFNISGNRASTIQPDVSTYAGDPAANGTVSSSRFSPPPFLSTVPGKRPIY